MADNPSGLTFHKHKFGLELSLAATPYYVASAAIYMRDPVLKAGSANTSIVKQDGLAGYPIGDLPDIAVCTAASRVSGVAIGKDVTNAGVGTLYSAASTADVIDVIDDPYVEFVIQEDSDSGDLAVTDVGQNAELIFTHSGDTSTGVSGAELDSSSAAGTAGHALRIVRFASHVEGNAIGTNGKWIVVINDHTELFGAGV